MSFPLFSICTDELISAPKIMTFLPTLPSGNECFICVLNPIPLPLYTYLSGSAFLANLTPPNNQLFNVNSESKSRGHESNS